MTTAALRKNDTGLALHSAGEGLPDVLYKVKVSGFVHAKRRAARLLPPGRAADSPAWPCGEVWTGAAND